MEDKQIFKTLLEYGNISCAT